MWGASPSDVWAAGNGSSGYSLWHYNGINWTAYKRPIPAFTRIFGFSGTDIWGCYAYGVYHSDGTTWEVNSCITLSKDLDILFSDIWGENCNVRYLVGGTFLKSNGAFNQGVIYKNNGSSWERVGIPKINNMLFMIRKQKGGLYYLGAVNLPEFDTYRVYSFDGKNIKEIFKSSSGLCVNDIAGSIYITVEKKIFLCSGDKLLKWKDFSGTSFHGRMWGRSCKDFFSVGDSGLVHYNGNNIKTIFPTKMMVTDMVVFEKDLFAIGDDRYIIHGKLKESN
jgi:hypothetical protein